MTACRYRFDRFLLDAGDRRLSRDGVPVELNARYLDALALLVREAGRLVPKDRFMAEVWLGVPVTDEALTQCIRTLRRQLGDDAQRPRFIETVPKHGYRFVAAVEPVDEASIVRAAASPPLPWPRLLRIVGAGAAGGAIAGIFGGLFYGFGAVAPADPGTGGASALLVLLLLNILLGLVGAAGVALGIVAMQFATGRTGHSSLLGGALGGLVVGAVAKLVGLDAFNLLFGQAPGDITGAPEGALLGAAVGGGLWLADGASPARHLSRGAGGAALAGAAAGLLTAALGGRLMGGSLDLLARRFPGSRLRLDQIGALFGEPGFGPLARHATAMLEGAIFATAVAAAMLLADRARVSPDGDRPLSP